MNRYVIASQHRTAEIFARRNGFKPGSYQIVTSPRDLKGVPPGQAWLMQGAWPVGMGEIRLEAFYRDIDIVEVDCMAKVNG